MVKMGIIEKIEELAKKKDLRPYQRDELIQLSKWAHPERRMERIKKKLDEWDISSREIGEDL